MCDLCELVARIHSIRRECMAEFNFRFSIPKQEANANKNNLRSSNKNRAIRFKLIVNTTTFL